MLAAQALYAHEVRPAYLELRQTAGNAYAVLWKVPAVGDMLIIGCDYHPSFQQIALVDTESGELQERRLKIGRAHV